MWCRSVFVSVLLLLGITHGIDVCRPFSVLGTKVELSDAFAYVMRIVCCYAQNGLSHRVSEPVRFEGGFLELLCTTERYSFVVLLTEACTYDLLIGIDLLLRFNEELGRY
jgi:hypothetical protein